MKAYVLQVLIVDHDELGSDNIRTTLEDASYPNDCIMPEVLKLTELEIGAWNDDHPLNHRDTTQAYLDQKLKEMRLGSRDE